MKYIFGGIGCWFRGKHVERRVEPSMLAMGVGEFNRVCIHCGRRRLAKQRKKAAA